MEVVIPVSGMSSTPSSPRRFGQYFFTSAPTSPTRISEFYREFDNFCMTSDGSRGSARTSGSSSVVPFDWEVKPGTPKSPKSTASASTLHHEDDFAFDFCSELEASSLSAEELFDGGRIRPLKPPPRLQHDDYTAQKSPLLSPRSPRSPRSPISQGRKIIREAFSPRGKKDVDPFATALENTRKKTDNERGRERRAPGLSTSSSRRATRSLSPFRVSAYPWEEEEDQKQQQQPNTTKQPSFSSNSSKGSSRKWRLRDFLLFRSASEGRAKGKDPFSKYANFFKKNDDTKNASFRSTDSSGSGSGSKRRGPVSAHELHYTKNKAASEGLKKKTFLPYKQGILGRLAINPAVHALANGFGNLKRS